MARYHTVLWDWNGTLLDDVELSLSVVNDILNDHGLTPLGRSRYLQIFDFPVQLYYERAGMDFSQVSFDAISDVFCRNFERRFCEADLFPTAADTLQSIKAVGLSQYVLSNTEHAALGRMLARYGLTEVLDGFQGNGDELARGKIGSGHQLLARHAIDTGGTVLVGDTFHDLEVAEALGVDCLLVSTGHHAHDRLTGLGYPVCLSLEQVSRRLLGVGAGKA